MSAARRPAVVPELERVTITAAAAAGLKQRYIVRQAAEHDLTTYLRAVTDALDIDPTRVQGFDDDTGELLLAPEEES